MRPVLSIPGLKPLRKLRVNEKGYRADGKVEVGTSSTLSPRDTSGPIADEDVDERAARRALDVDGWMARRGRS